MVTRLIQGLLVGAMLVLGSVVSGRAQDAPLPGLPEASAIGDGWIQFDQSGATEPGRTTNTGVYHGDEAMALIQAMHLDSTDTARDAAWTDANLSLDYFKSPMDTVRDSESDRSLADPLESCDDIRRIDNSGDPESVPTGVTLCRAAPDTIVIAFAIGEVNDLSGPAASDFLVTRSLAYPRP